MAEGDRIDDREVWARCNPAHPARISMEYMKREFLAFGPEQFARERIGKSNWPLTRPAASPSSPARHGKRARTPRPTPAPPARCPSASPCPVSATGLTAKLQR